MYEFDEVSIDLPPPSLIKIDIEGAEVAALRGAKLARHRPCLIVEFHEPGLVEQARAILPEYDFRALDGSQWFLTSAEGGLLQ